jgi:hypothetical protein
MSTVIDQWESIGPGERRILKIKVIVVLGFRQIWPNLGPWDTPAAPNGKNPQKQKCQKLYGEWLGRPVGVQRAWGTDGNRS